MGCGAWIKTGWCDMKNQQKSKIKREEAQRKNRFNQGMRKREEELNDRNKPLTCTLAELVSVNETKGFMTYKDLRLKNMERRDEGYEH